MANFKWLIVYLLVLTIIMSLAALVEANLTIEYWSEKVRSVVSIIIGIFSLIYLIIFGLSKVE